VLLIACFLSFDLIFVLFTYCIDNSLVIISINSGSWGGVMVIRLGIEILETGKGGTKRGGGGKRGG
jgi:hypothetical protein